MKPRKINRFLLKLSGEFLSVDKDFGIDASCSGCIVSQIKTLIDSGVEGAIVVGGGNILRGGRENSLPVSVKRATADSMGMLATVINGLALRDMLEDGGVQVDLLSSCTIDTLVTKANYYLADKALSQGKVVIFVGGTGNPFVTTDSAASLRAIEIGADVLLKATNVNGVFDKDPSIFTDAKLQKELSFNEVIDADLKVMDLGAFAQCREFDMPIYVFNMDKKNALIDICLNSDDSGSGTWIY